MSENNPQAYFVPVAIIIAGALVAGGIYFSGGVKTGTQTAQVDQKKDIPVVRGIDSSDHVRGDRNAKIVIVEYSDLQCPFCSQFHTTMKQVIEKYGADKQVAWVYRHFPLSSIHPEARPAAIAAECVAKLKGDEAFWRFADAIFADQANIGQPLFEKLAGAEGISAADLAKCVADPAIAKRITDDEQEIMAQGAQGTPFSVVLKDQKSVNVIPGALGFTDVSAGIDSLLK